MKILKSRLILFFIFSLAITAFAQKDLTFYKSTVSFYGKPDTILTMKLDDVAIPPSLESFKTCFHFPPVRQDTTGTCWAFSAISFFETEAFRLTGQKIKLSEMYVAYWEYVAKTQEYIRTRGKSLFAQGSQEAGALLRMKEYGIVPLTDYTGLIAGREKHSHDKLHEQMHNYLKLMQEQGIWDEAIILTQIKMLLDRHLGKPPETIEFNGEQMTPKEFLEKVLQLQLDDYVDLMSFKYHPFYTKGSYKVPDNYWYYPEYYNIPLDEWYAALVSAIKNGYTIGIGGDVSEIGKIGEADVAFIPDFDIPSKYINQDAREFRFDNKTSEDDHGIHLVGYQNYKGHDWFLIKDSGNSATKGKYSGYFFYRGDFVKLKMLTFMVHKNAVEQVLKKFSE
jgi:bleomycin hydrolase